jgi:hypothetical protein
VPPPAKPAAAISVGLNRRSRIASRGRKQLTAIGSGVAGSIRRHVRALLPQGED